MGRLTRYTPEIMDEIIRLKGKSSYEDVTKIIRDTHPELNLPEDVAKASHRLRQQVVLYRKESKKALEVLNEIESNEVRKATEVPSVKIPDNPDEDNPGYKQVNPTLVCTEEICNVLKPLNFQERVVVLAYMRGAKWRDAVEIGGFTRAYAWKLYKKDEIQAVLDNVAKVMVKSTQLNVEYVVNNILEDIERRHHPKERSKAIDLASQILGMKSSDPMGKTVPATVHILLQGKENKVAVVGGGNGCDTPKPTS
jgi:hypothetical protein